jgi:hypothetical protein
MILPDFTAVEVESGSGTKLAGDKCETVAGDLAAACRFRK